MNMFSHPHTAIHPESASWVKTMNNTVTHTMEQMVLCSVREEERRGVEVGYETLLKAMAAAASTAKQDDWAN